MNRPSTAGQRIRQHRRALGLSQAELGQRLRLTQARVSQIENDDAVPRRTLTEVARALDVDVAALIGDDDRYDLHDWEDASLQLISTLGVSGAALVGREDLVAGVAALLRAPSTRLLTLTGPGGVGKTQVALHAAAEVKPVFADGVAVALLAACRNLDQVISAVAQAAGLGGRDTRPVRARLVNGLRSEHRLLVLDNVEHLQRPTVSLVTELLAACPRLQILLTSRSKLRLAEQHEIPVPPLVLPDKEAAQTVTTIAVAPAVRLFEQRARAVATGFAVTEANAVAVAEICHRLDGLPLAIELAAARVGAFPPDSMLRQLERRYAFLNVAPRRSRDRRQTLHSMVAWSYDLLLPEDRLLFRRLAVFAGGFTFDAAETVIRDEGRDGKFLVPRPSSFIDFSGLLDQNLLVRTEHADGVRFEMLETIRAFGLEQLESSREADELRRRHLVWCLDLADRALPRLFTAEEAIWLRRLNQEDANLQAALAWGLAAGQPADREAGLRLAAALTDAWYLRGRLAEGRHWLDLAVKTSRDWPPSIGRARILVGACQIAQEQGAVKRGAAYGEAGLAMARKLDDLPTMARGLALLGIASSLRGELDQAQALHAESLELFRRLENRPWTVLDLVNLAVIARKGQDLPAAVAHAEQALELAREIGDDWDAGLALGILGDVACHEGNLDRAEVHHREQLRLALQRRSQPELANALGGFGALAFAKNELERTARLFGAADALYRELGIRMPPPIPSGWQDAVRRLRTELGPETFARCWETATSEAAIAEILQSKPPGLNPEA